MKKHKFCQTLKPSFWTFHVKMTQKKLQYTENKAPTSTCTQLQQWQASHLCNKYGLNIIEVIDAQFICLYWVHYVIG